MPFPSCANSTMFPVFLRISNARYLLCFSFPPLGYPNAGLHTHSNFLPTFNGIFRPLPVPSVILPVSSGCQMKAFGADPLNASLNLFCQKCASAFYASKNLSADQMGILSSACLRLLDI